MAAKVSDTPAVKAENSNAGAIHESPKVSLEPVEPEARANRRDADVFNEALQKMHTNMYQHLRSLR